MLKLYKTISVSLLGSAMLLIAPVDDVVCLANDDVKTNLRQQSAEQPVKWPSFLGRGATVVDADSVPEIWTPNQNMAWKTKLNGQGQSSPVVWGDQVFVTSIQGAMKDICIVTALSLIDGQILWTHQLPASQPVRSNYYQSRSAPTCVVDADGVYAFFETGDLVALRHDGQVRWSRSLVDDYGEFEVRIGLSSSLTQTGDRVVVLVDHEGPSYLLAVEKSTGQNAWKTERFSRQSYSSPIVLSIAGSPQIVVSSAGSVDGYDPDDGKMLWTFEEVGGNRSTTPLPVAENRFLISASPGMHDEYAADARKSNLVMEIETEDTPAGTRYTPQVVWRTNRAMPSFGSPMVYRSLAYWVTRIGVVFCFDVATGEKVYSARLGQSCWATPIGIGDYVYFFGKDGTTIVVKAGRKFEVVHRNELWAAATERGKAAIKRQENRAKRKPASKTSSPATKGEDKSQEEQTPRRGRDGLLFAEDVQYGYAVVGDSIVIRTGSQVFCIRNEVREEDSEEGNSQKSDARGNSIGAIDTSIESGVQR